MTDQEALENVRLHCLEVAAMRNQKLSASAGDIVNEANVYAQFVQNGVAKSKQPVKT
jgi:hypothetical protein